MKARIIANTTAAAHQIAAEEGLPPNSYRVVNGKADLQGFRGVVLVDTSSPTRKDYNDVMDLVTANKCSVIYTSL